MAYGAKYLFKFESIHGVEYRIYIYKDGYSGNVIQRRLGRAPVLRKKQNGPICATSLELWAECSVDGEFAEFYTSNPKEFSVGVHRGGVGEDAASLIWRGFISPELYSEPNIAPPYDVQVVATDGLGELKLHDYEAQGEISLRDMLYYLLGESPLYLATNLRADSDSRAGILSWQINMDYMEGKTQYDVLTSILESIGASITFFNNGWLISRELDIESIYSGAKGLSVVYAQRRSSSPYVTTIDNVIMSVGMMGVADLWPVGYLSTKITPAKRKVVVKAPWHINPSLLKDPTMVDEIGESWLYSTQETPIGLNGLYKVPNRGYYLNGDGVQNTVVAIWQEYPANYLSGSFSAIIRAMKTRSDAPNESILYACLEYHVGNDIYYGSSKGWIKNSPDNVDALSLTHNVAAYPIVSPDAYDEGLEYGDECKFEIPLTGEIPSSPGTLFFVLEGRAVYLNEARLSFNREAGFQDTIHIDNDARGEADEVEIAGGRVLSDGLDVQPFYQGVWRKNSTLITSFSDSRYSNADFLSIQTLGRATAVALAKKTVEGVIDVPSGVFFLPLILTSGGSHFWIDTFDWDLYQEEARISMLSTTVAVLHVQSEVVTPIQSGASSGSSSSGGSGGGGAGGATMAQVQAWVNKQGYLTGITSEEVCDALGYVPAITNSSSQAPTLRVFRGYNNSGEITPYIQASHPLLGAGLNAEAVLMAWSNRRGRIGATSIKLNPTYVSGWGEVRGKRATSAPFTFGGYATLDSIRQFVLNRCLCGLGFTEEQMEAMALSTFKASTAPYSFGFKGKHGQSGPAFKSKHSRLFGIAIRYENPEWTAAVTGSVAETTREVTINQRTIRRYIYTDIAPLRLHCNRGKDGKWTLGFQLQPIIGPTQ